MKTFGVVLLMSLVLGTYGSPVIIWGSFSSEQKPALYNVKQNEFAKIVKPKLKDSMVVVFLEPELNTIDFRMKTDNAESCYANLKKLPNYTYFTSVSKPVEALREITQNQVYAVVNKDGYLQPEINYEKNKIVFIDLTNADINRSMLLKKHDDTINKIYEKFSTVGETTGIYTSSKPAEHRIRRAAKAKNEGEKFLKPEFLLYYTMLRFKEADKEPVTLKASSIDVSMSNNSLLTVKLTTDHDPITFDIVSKHGYFTMKNLKYGGQMFLVGSGVEAPIGYSFVCGDRSFTAATNPNSNQAAGSLIMWKGLQMQARFDKEEQKELVFGEPWDCSGFFSAGILSGLFVVSMLLFILGVAIAWLMDINTMDRFENNRSGKTITINASD